MGACPCAMRRGRTGFIAIGSMDTDLQFARFDVVCHSACTLCVCGE